MIIKIFYFNYCNEHIYKSNLQYNDIIIYTYIYKYKY